MCITSIDNSSFQGVTEAEGTVIELPVPPKPRDHGRPISSFQKDVANTIPTIHSSVAPSLRDVQYANKGQSPIDNPSSEAERAVKPSAVSTGEPVMSTAISQFLAPPSSQVLCFPSQSVDNNARSQGINPGDQLPILCHSR